MAERVSPSDLEGLDRNALVALLLRLVDTVEQLQAANEKLTAEVERLRAEAGRNSGYSSKPSSRDTAAERRRQADVPAIAALTDLFTGNAWMPPQAA